MGGQGHVGYECRRGLREIFGGGSFSFGDRLR